MALSRRLQPVAVALFLAFLLSSCVVTGVRRVITRGHKKVTGAGPVLKVATQDDLTAMIAHNYNAIQSFQATKVNLTPSQGSIYVGNVKDYKDWTGYIIFHKPANIRIGAYLPVVGTLAFEMVSNGSDFRFHLQPKNLFVEGANSAPATSANKIENLRPEAFLSSMLIRPADPATESLMLKDDTDEENALYRLEFNRKGPGGSLIPGREVWFDRLDLTIARQKTYDEKGDIESDTSYSKWQLYNGVSFPSHIDINRRKEGYGITIDIIKMEMNTEIPESKFILEQPPGSKLQVIR